MHFSGDDLSPISSSFPPIPSPGKKVQTDLDDGAISKKTLGITHHTLLLHVLRTCNLRPISNGLHKKVSNARSFGSAFLSIGNEYGSLCDSEAVVCRCSVK